MSKKLRLIISGLLLLAALTAAVIYLADHRSLVKQLKQTPLSLSLIILALYGIMFVALMLVLQISITICRRHFARNENAQLNAHSLLINFFIPGQGGPAYRGVYLYRRYKLTIKNYLTVTFLYYLIYAVIAVCLLLGGNRPWWQTTAVALVITGLGYLGIKRYSKRAHLKEHALDLKLMSVLGLVLATMLQAVVQVTIYAFELHSVNHHIHLSQVITYTGAADLALFVSLTPGAIGIRESFLIFTKHLHHISSGNIIVANVIDRSVYLAFLLILTVLVVGLYLRGRFSLKKLPSLIKQSLSSDQATI